MDTGVEPAADYIGSDEGDECKPKSDFDIRGKWDMDVEKGEDEALGDDCYPIAD